MNGENIMFKSVLLFIFLVGCEAATVEFAKSVDSSDEIEDVVEFDDCGYEVGMSRF